MSGERELPAGDFSAWLQHARKALRDGSGTDVACGECVGCCSSSYFIEIEPTETQVLAQIPGELLVPAPGHPRGHVLMGHDARGCCPMLKQGRCSIYTHRPHTCRTYDCRIFTAAGIAAGGDERAEINRRVRRWKFSYPTEQDRAEHRAVQAVTEFIRGHVECFPDARVPSDPGQLALVAIKVYELFLDPGHGALPPDSELAGAIIEACRRFDA